MRLPLHDVTTLGGLLDVLDHQRDVVLSLVHLRQTQVDGARLGKVLPVQVESLANEFVLHGAVGHGCGEAI